MPAVVGAIELVTNRGHRGQDVIDELQRYVTGWLTCFGISHTYNQVADAILKVV